MTAKVMSMDCSQFEEAIESVDCVSIQEAAVPEAALAHAELCDDCARLFLGKLLKSQTATGKAKAVR
jgi:hypothetical protein